ncbi:hypothetical protein EPUS_08939 [Endocarpon pusillum Z07020]|uniref:Uncharacterized protein n=1 Tax=Endocarpon pusillum (strain Z07020 / HMAS-L-300199) TaxID=1263415 RepID=U1GQA7_ENDPU|nr:uncharacterized protein EPUS_08939 [Endocarpon pusillum Z07020]ERF74528.1 hypothetical protein EPUS_08939 [Endocarpon pusillum Z07020]
MGKPRLIILIRHAQSEGNKNRDIHQTVPDHRVRLTPEGHQQALEAGRKLRALLRPDDTLHFFTSPYRRTRETTEGILSALTSDDPSPSPFPRNTIKVYEEPRLREQDFGNFQPCSAEMERMWQARADYGHFFYRIPNGESAADAYDRISGFNDSLWRRFEENDFASVCILVTHGLMTRVFLMKWYHFSVEYFEDLRNVNHCEFVVMKKNLANGKFILQNQLRTWSELKRERAARDSINHANNAAPEPGIGDSPIPQRRRWGSCPDGCDHSQHNHGLGYSQPKRQNTADLFKDDNEILSSSFKDASRSSSRSNSIKLNQTRSPPCMPQSRDRYPPHTGGKNRDSAASGDLSLPDNEETILDQDSAIASPATQLPFHSSSRTSKNRFRSAQPGSMSLNETLIEEELSPNLQTEGVPTPKHFAVPPPSAGYPAKHPSTTAITPEILNRKLRSPRELALISMAGRDGGGSRSGAGSSDEADAEEEQSISQLPPSRHHLLQTMQTRLPIPQSDAPTLPPPPPPPPPPSSQRP